MTAFRALTDAQRHSADALVAAGRLRRAPVDVTKAAAFMRQAVEALDAAGSIASAGVRFDVSYNAAHDVGEAMLAAYGYRTASGPGAHLAVGDVLRVVFDGPPAHQAAASFDSIRAVRNGLRYQAKSPSRAETTVAEQIARALLEGARDRAV